MPLIEPSHISKNETILDVILSRLYTNFCEWNEKEKATSDEIRKVYELFNNAFGSVRAYCKSREARHSDSNSFEALNYTAAGNNIKENMRKLIFKYLDVVCKADSSYLVISVDDVDMNINQGYNICEDLRKYFSMSRVIILFSFKEAQLSDIVKQEYLEFYKSTLTIGKNVGVNLNEDITDMAAKYLDKLIPFNRKCAMPQYNISNISDLKILDDDNNEPRNLVDKILRLFYDKIGLLLVKNRHGSHPLVPTNLRGIIHLKKTLDSMGSIKLFDAQKLHILSGSEQKTLNTNLVHIHRYFQNLCADKFNFESAYILKRVSEEPLDTLNQSIAKLTYNTYAKLHSEISLSTTRNDTLPENVDFCDVMELANDYCTRKHFADGKSELFIELLLALYSTKVVRLLFCNSNTIDEFKVKKDKLYKVLGAICDSNKFTPYFEQTGLLIKNITDVKLLDMSLMHTFNLGQIPNSWKSHLLYPRYELINRKNMSGKGGNTYVYFAMNAMACITNSLSNDILIESYEYKDKYANWRNQYVGVLPLFSLNATNHILKNAPYIFGKKREEDYYTEFIKAMKTQLNQSIAACSISDECSNWLKSAAETFPFWNSPIEKFIEMCSTALKSDLEISNKSEAKITAFVDSLAYSIKNINICSLKYEHNINDWDYFKNAFGVTRSSNYMQQEHFDFLQTVNSNIAQRKAELLRLEHTDENLRLACAEICDILKAAQSAIPNIAMLKVAR